MALQATESYLLEVDQATTLPDPATVNGRTHQIDNTSTATITITSTGATPFTENGVNVVSITLARGASKLLQSNGTRWVVINNTAGRHQFAATGVTDASGNVTFTYATPFVNPVVEGQIGPSADTALVEGRLTASTTTSCTFNVRRSPSVVILGISVLQVPQNAPGVTVQCFVTEAGETL
jgi:hypothetical protein